MNEHREDVVAYLQKRKLKQAMNKNGNITKIMKSKEEKKTQKKIDEARNNSKNKREKGAKLFFKRKLIHYLYYTCLNSSFLNNQSIKK